MRPSKPKVVPDTNVLVSGVLFKDGSEARILQLAQEGHILVFLSMEVLTEFVNVLSRPKFRLTNQEILAATEHVLSFARLRQPTTPAKIRIRADPCTEYMISCSAS